MEFITNTSEPIDKHSLCVFYMHAILPNYDVRNTDITWYDSKEWIPGDEVMFRFKAGETNYVLIFEDHNSGENKSVVYDTFIRTEVLQPGQSYEFVYPKSRKETDPDPTFNGYDLSGYALYCPYITGTYTLLRISDAGSKQLQ